MEQEIRTTDNQARMSDICWYCSRDLLWQSDAELIKDCPRCGVKNNRVPYIPIKDNEIVEPLQILKEKKKMIPIIEGNIEFSPWIKLPNPLEKKEGEIKENDMVVILTELQAPPNPKIKSFLLGEVELGKEKRTIGLNQTSYFTIAKAYGKDTKDWIGKKLVYRGLRKLGQGTGHLWSAEGQEIK